MAKTRTLDELRDKARAAGLRGYSSMRKDELVALLEKPPKVSVSKSVKTKPIAAKSATKKSKAAPARTKTKSSPVRAAPAKNGARLAVSGEEEIERHKFEMTPPGITHGHSARVSKLVEDIDNLPPPRESVLCVLPQKPGVLHAYWVLVGGAVKTSLKLHLCRITDEAVELIEEIEANGARGHWYFQVPENERTEGLVVRLGFYQGKQFVTAIRRGIARVPSLNASDRTDRSWWISDEQFKSLYERSGGIVQGGRLRWGATATSSPTSSR